MSVVQGCRGLPTRTAKLLSFVTHLLPSVVSCQFFVSCQHLVQNCGCTEAALLYDAIGLTLPQMCMSCSGHVAALSSDY